MNADERHKRMVELARPAMEESIAKHNGNPAYVDDAAVDAFAVAMKAKMAASRAKGRRGWGNKSICTQDYLQKMLVEHLTKGDPVDVGNFAMMLFNRGERTAPPAPRLSEGQIRKVLQEARDKSYEEIGIDTAAWLMDESLFGELLGYSRAIEAAVRKQFGVNDE